MSETDLRWRLRQLPRGVEPSRDLWPAIQAGIERRPLRKPRRWLTGLALAASVLLAGGLFWQRVNHGAPTATDDPTAKIVTSESRAITDEYQAALRQYDGAPIAPQLSPSLSTLDRSVAQIQSALVADPHSLFLLQQLRKTYSLRLSLTQRAVTG
jgi:hypothetical protein